MRRKNFEILAAVVFLMNFISIIHGMIYQEYTRITHYWTFAGILFLLTIMANCVLFVLHGKRDFPNKRRLRRFKISSYCYFFFILFASFLLFIANFLGFDSGLISEFLLGFMLYVGYYGLLIFPSLLIVLFVFSKKNFEEIELKDKENMGRILEIILRIIFILSGSIGLIVGLLTNLTILFRVRFGLLTFFFSVFAAMSGIFFGIGTISNTAILLHVMKKNAKYFKQISVSILTLGLIVSSICFLPLFSTPSFTAKAEKEFSSAFNPYLSDDWTTLISQSGYESYFLNQPFQLMGYFLNTGDPKCYTIRDILYFNGTKSNYEVDKNILLYFDAYLPPEGSTDLPGNNSVIIRIHGGGWTIGDKGLGNIQMMNQYFAAQGYCVFDIQYGLTNRVNNLGNIYQLAENVIGNFTIDDMMRHIGNFTHFLANNAARYSCNLDSVFISGGSAGGQLTCATALSIDSGNYTEFFTDQMTIKGLIPFYPANNVSYEFALVSKQEWVNPEKLVTLDSPPCLIFQGEKDSLIRQSTTFKNAYLSKGRSDCALLVFPFGGHGCDIYYPGYYNQVFLYFMERFLFLYH